MNARLVPDMPEADYLAHPAIGSSDLKHLLESPLAFRWAKDHRSESTDAQRFGSLVHALALGGIDVVVVDADSWRTNDAKAARAEAEARGVLACLPKDRDDAMVLVNRLHEHPLAGPLLKQEGHTEASTFWTDETGIEQRARFDLLPEKPRNGKLVTVDLKTAADPNPLKWIKAAGDFGVHLQDDHYRAAARALGLHEDPSLVFVVIGSKPPHDIAVIELAAIDRDLARRQRAHALRLYAECSEKDEWPGIPARVHHPTLPPFYTYAAEEALIA